MCGGDVPFPDPIQTLLGDRLGLSARIHRVGEVWEPEPRREDTPFASAYVTRSPRASPVLGGYCDLGIALKRKGHLAGSSQKSMRLLGSGSQSR